MTLIKVLAPTILVILYVAPVNAGKSPSRSRGIFVGRIRPPVVVIYHRTGNIDAPDDKPFIGCLLLAIGSVISLFFQGESRQWASLSGLRTARKLLTKVYHLC
ncbi:MAG: hypothetical protein ACFFCW_34470 [Candidatus Hodarchaeota archaeon]